MRRIWLLILGVWMLFSACSSPEQKAQKEIAAMEESLFNEEMGLLSPRQTEKLVGLYMDYAADFSEDHWSPEYLFRAADVSMNVGNSALALNLFSRIRKEYPHYEKVAQCLFLQGFIWDNNMGDVAKARELYTLFLKLYPDNEFADDVKMSIEYLGKSSEELIESFEKYSQEE
ncbi:MAG: hypothetical protein CSA95_06635 [Bacteroidetes bacterium]|nr:MAG: hypothetical protein CSA95_06635 [Bacteroidota bacterium]